MSNTRRAADPRTAVAYVRVSTDEQRNGPDAQRAAIAAWAARQGVTVVAWHVDQGVSGAADLADRPALLAALADLRAHRAGVLLVAKRDRLARDVLAAATIERDAGRAGARIASAAGEGTDASADDPSARLQRGIHDLFAEHERAMIRARTRAALAVKRARGERVGCIAYGFKLAADGVHVEPDAAEQGVIARVHELRDAGLSQRAIAAELARAGIVGRTGKPFAQPQVARMCSTVAA